MPDTSPIALLVVSLGFCMPLRAQSGNLILNGDFENVVGAGCMSNLQNSALSTTLPTLTGFGTVHGIDVYKDQACWGLPAFSGTTKLAVDTTGVGTAGAFSFGLSAPIFSGTSYALSFQAHAVPDFQCLLGTLDVGISNDPMSFGTLVFSVNMPAFLVWNAYSTSFFAPVNAQYLTVRSGGTIRCWTHTDAFVLTTQNGAEYCAGDGSNTPCPCGNDAPFGSDTGCLNSHGAGGRLRAQGFPSLSADSFVLVGDQMGGNGSAMYLQGMLQSGGGSGVVLADGLRCVSGSVVRLGVKPNVAGGSQYPQTGDIPISLRGLISAPGVRNYQVWYRDAASFCTPAPFNLTNGIEVTWGT